MLIRTIASRFFALLVLTGALSLTVGCNTAEGVGKDTERAGEKIQDAAD